VTKIVKKILVIYYSQSGQLKDISNNLIEPLKESDSCEIDYYNIQPENPFPFPWNGKTFYDAFPESFQQIPVDIIPPPKEILDKKYDLIIFAYQVWFLSPSIPINSFLKSKYAKEILADTPIVTVIGCRNMWIMSHEKVKKLIAEANGKLVGNLSFVDRHINHVSVITIVHWMFSGEKTKFLGIFPKPGVSETDISSASKFGEIILNTLKNKDYSTLKKDLYNAGGVLTKPFLVLMDQKANKMFSLWSKFVLKKNKNRSFKLFLFKIYLWLAIWVISPIVFLLFLITYPIKKGKIDREMNYYRGIE
jgi:hypothetical protein